MAAGVTAVMPDGADHMLYAQRVPAIEDVPERQQCGGLCQCSLLASELAFEGFDLLAMGAGLPALGTALDLGQIGGALTIISPALELFWIQAALAAVRGAFLGVERSRLDYRPSDS